MEVGQLFLTDRILTRVRLGAHTVKMPKARTQGQSLVLWLEFSSRKKSRLWTLCTFQVWATKLLFVARRGTESTLTRSFQKAGSRIPQEQEAKVAGTVPTVPGKPPHCSE